MKRTLLFIVLITMLSCQSGKKTEALNAFIRGAKKPITCRPVATNIITGHATYTLAAADGRYIQYWYDSYGTTRHY